MLTAQQPFLANRAQKPVVGLKVFGWLQICSRDFRPRYRRFYCGGDCRSHLILEFEHVFKRAVELFCPEMCACTALDELAGNANLLSCLAHAALKNVPYPQLAANLLHVHRLALVGKARIAGR